MRDPIKFRKLVAQYRKRVGCTEEDLARELSMSKGELNKCLHEYKHAPSAREWSLSDAQVFRIIEVLADWKAITRRQQAIDLLSLMKFPDLDTIDWDVTPLRRLSFHETSVLPRHQPVPLERLQSTLYDFNQVRSLVDNFVGRETELEEVRRLINVLSLTGGYLTITGPAGQGKSSLIAVLVEADGPEDTAYHFIPIQPGPDYQISLLHNLLTRFILKYHLSEWYLEDTSRPVLRDRFHQVLQQIATQGAHEVIYIDGLDQLGEELDGSRDLTFLPNTPPEGIVFVLGTRPDDTLVPLELRKPLMIYDLPQLRRSDFDLLLSHHRVTLTSLQADKFYHLLQGNALFLNRVAVELVSKNGASPETIIAHIANSPENLFGLSMDRLGRQADTGLWNQVIKPTLAVLLVTREPLASSQIKNLIGVDSERFRRGVRRLGGLLRKDEREHYTLFHMKLRDYLQPNEQEPGKESLFATDEIRAWHWQLATWCQQGDLELLWQDVKGDPVEQRRREYARRHYAAHLFYAQNWSRLFAVLDNATYRKAKLRFDRSTRAYAEDLQFGQLVAASERWTLEEGVNLLPRLWHYSLLRCSLRSNADIYPLKGFRLLVSLGRTQEALDLVELLSYRGNEVERLFQIAEQLVAQQDQSNIYVDILHRTYDTVISYRDTLNKVWGLERIGIIQAQAQQWEQAKDVWEQARQTIPELTGAEKQIEELIRFGRKLALMQQWDQARELYTEALEIITRELESKKQYERELIRELEYQKRCELLSELGLAFAQAQNWNQARAVWMKAEQVIKTLKGVIQDDALHILARSLAKAQQWEQARALIDRIDFIDFRSHALRDLGIALAQAQQLEQAEALLSTIGDEHNRNYLLQALGAAHSKARQWEKARACIGMVKLEIIQDEIKCTLAVALTQAELWERAQEVISSIQYSQEKARALLELGTALIQADQLKKASKVLSEAKQVINLPKKGYWPIDARRESLSAVGILYVQARLLEEAEAVREDIDKLIAREEAWAANSSKSIALRALGITLAQAKLWEQAKTVIDSIPARDCYAEALALLGVQFANTQQLEKAISVWREAERVIDTLPVRRDYALRKLGTTLAQAHQWNYAEEVLEKAKHFIDQQDDNSGREEELLHSALVLTQARHPEQIETEPKYSRSDSYKHAEALRKQGMALFLSQQWEQARDIWSLAKEIIDSLDVHERDLARRELAIDLARASMWEQAERVADSMGGIEQADALEQLSTCLARAHEYERLLHLIQRYWKLARTSSEIFRLFPMVTGFIEYAPELGRAFYEVF